MTTSLYQLPFDILFHIISELPLVDAVHLGQTCQHLQDVLAERTICRRILGAISHTEEARLALAKREPYRNAIQAIYDRHYALSNASPFAARILCQGSSFLCRQGVICVLQGDFIQVSRVHQPAEMIRFNLASMIRPRSDPLFSLKSCRVSLLYYSDDILSMLVERISRPNSPHIVSVSTSSSTPNDKRLLKAINLEESCKVFARHNSRYLYYGTHTGVGDDGHHKWEIFGESFHEENNPLPEVEQPILLQNFHGTDIGSTVAFELHGEYFYAVSNQGTFEVEEVDWTSFYHCVRFRLDDPDPEKVKKNARVYRRQHAQGPIHDSWTDLSLQTSEETGDMMIVESRREWARASSKQSRTFYVSKFECDENDSRDDLILSNGEFNTALLPKNDSYVGVLDCTNKPNYMPTPPLYSYSQHPEFKFGATTGQRSFTLSRTKFRAYNYSCATFVDLVEDDQCCADPSKPPCLRLRIGSRRQMSPTLAPSLSKGKGRVDNVNTSPDFEDKHTDYRHSPIRMFPRPAAACPCSARLHDIMNPPLPAGSSTHSRSVTGMLDDRCLVYMVKPGRSYGASDDDVQGTIVVVDFTRPWRTTDEEGGASHASTASLSTYAVSDTVMMQNGLSVPATPMARKDSTMDYWNEPCDTADALHKHRWRWSPGQNKRCKAKTCQ